MDRPPPAGGSLYVGGGVMLTEEQKEALVLEDIALDLIDAAHRLTACKRPGAGVLAEVIYSLALEVRGTKERSAARALNSS